MCSVFTWIGSVSCRTGLIFNSPIDLLVFFLLFSRFVPCGNHTHFSRAVKNYYHVCFLCFCFIFMILSKYEWAWNNTEVGGQMLAALFLFVASAKIKISLKKEIKSNEQNRSCNVQLFSAFVIRHSTHPYPETKEKEKKNIK